MYLESEPLAQAHTELRAETSLEREDVSPLIQGGPLNISGGKTRKWWRVRPFPAEGKDTHENSNGWGERCAALVRAGGSRPPRFRPWPGASLSVSLVKLPIANFFLTPTAHSPDTLFIGCN